MDLNVRELLEVAVGEPPIQLTMEGVRRRALRRRMAQLGAATLAFALVAGLGAAVAVAVSPRPPSVSHPGPPSGPPRYYVQKYYDQRAKRNTLVVRATATGRITAVIGKPRPGVQCGGGNVGFAAAGTRTFFLTCVIWHTAGRAGGGKIVFLESFIYRFQLTGAGKVVDYSLLKGGVFKGLWAYNIAASPNGSLVAVQVIRPEPSGQIYTNTIPEGIFVLNTRTGARALWRVGPYRPGVRQFDGANDISFTREDGLVLMGVRCDRSRYDSNCDTNAQAQVRAYGPADRGGSLEQGRVLLGQRVRGLAGSTLIDALISPDGSAVTASVDVCPRHGTCGHSLVLISVSTGRVERVLYPLRPSAGSQAVSFRFFTVDPTGRFLIVDAFFGSRVSVNGWINHGRLVPLASIGSNILEHEAW